MKKSYRLTFALIFLIVAGGIVIITVKDESLSRTCIFIISVISIIIANKETNDFLMNLFTRQKK